MLESSTDKGVIYKSGQTLNCRDIGSFEKGTRIIAKLTGVLMLTVEIGYAMIVDEENTHS